MKWWCIVQGARQTAGGLRLARQRQVRGRGHRVSSSGRLAADEGSGLRQHPLAARVAHPRRRSRRRTADGWRRETGHGITPREAPTMLLCCGRRRSRPRGVHDGQRRAAGRPVARRGRAGRGRRVARPTPPNRPPARLPRSASRAPGPRAARVRCRGARGHRRAGCRVGTVHWHASLRRSLHVPTAQPFKVFTVSDITP